MKKRKVLLYWGYNRKAWVEPFNQIQDRFEFTYLFHAFSDQETELFIDAPRVYWSSYKNADELLREVQPEVVIFMGIDSPLTMALNWLCKRESIPSLVVQHGLFHELDAYEELHRAQEKRKLELPDSPSPKAIPRLRKMILSFFLRTLRGRDWEMHRLLYSWYQSKKTQSGHMALAHNISEKRRADVYAVYTKASSRIFVERDGVPENRFVEFGNPEMDEFLQQKELLRDGDYILLIDSPVAEVKDFNSPGYGPSKEYVVEVYQRLQKYAESVNWTLKVKLHPYSYSSDFYSHLEGIEFIKECNLPELILGSKAVLGFFSTLVLPAVYFKPTILFRLFESSRFSSKLSELKLVKELDYMNFKVEDIQFLEEPKPADSMRIFEADFLYKTDGKCTERLSRLIEEL